MRVGVIGDDGPRSDVNSALGNVVRVKIAAEVAPKRSILNEEPGTLTLRHTVDKPELAPMMAAGWHLCLDVADHLLDGDPVGPIRGAEAMDFGWDELRDAYAERLAAEPPAH